MKPHRYMLGSHPSYKCRRGQHEECAGTIGQGAREFCTCRFHGPRGFMPKTAVVDKLPMIKLQDAYLCADLNCKTISINSRECPVCSSEVLSLSASLNREEGK